MTASGVRRGKAALSSGCKSHPANAPAGSNRSSHEGDEMAEAFGRHHSRLGSGLTVRDAFESRPESGEQPKQVARNLTFALERPKLEVFSPWLMPGQNGHS